MTTLRTLAGLVLLLLEGLLATMAIRYRKELALKLAEYARQNSFLHPEDFFNYYYQGLSPCPPRFPLADLRHLPFHEADYRSNGKIDWTYKPLIQAIFSTSTLARMAMAAYREKGPDKGRDAFDGLARLWGSRIAQVFQAKISVLGAETIPPLEGKTLLLFNHQSYLDFALNFFALSCLKKTDGRHLSPRFIAAKDHFIDNPLLYSWIGLGKVIENAGMIFINRQKKGQGWAAMEEAAEKLCERDVEIAVYPQGTRALPMRSATGERRDAGYYTTFSRKNWADPLGHLKPGTAHLILDSLGKLRKRGESQLHVLAVGIVGAAIAAPRGAMKVQTLSEIEFRLAPLWTLPTSLADGTASPRGLEPQNPEERLYVERISELQGQINRHLLQALDWHRKLREIGRFETTRLGFKPEEIEKLERALEKAEVEENPYPFILLDRIFSLDPSLWERFLKLFLSLQTQATSSGALMPLLQEVSERLME